MSENKFTPRAEEALRLSQEAAEEMATATLAPSICCLV